MKKSNLTKINSLVQTNFNDLTVEGYLNSLPIEQVGNAFNQLKALGKFCGDVVKTIEKQVKEGTEIPNLKLVTTEGKSSEGLVGDINKIGEELNKMGFSDDAIFKPKELKSWTDIKKLVKTAGVNKLKEKGFVGTKTASPKEEVIYIDPTNIVDAE